jgi:hypothetical protein
LAVQQTLAYTKDVTRFGTDHMQDTRFRTILRVRHHLGISLQNGHLAIRDPLVSPSKHIVRAVA